MTGAPRQLIRREDIDKLLANGREQARVKGTARELELQPIAKLVVPFTACVWLLSELEPDDPEIAFGLCDLGVGFPELGSVWLPELLDLNVRGLRVLQVVPWRADRTLNQYAREASAAQRIVC